MILHKHEQPFIFVHVQKTAGLSIEDVLKRQFPNCEKWHGRHGHAKNGITEIGLDAWQQYYSFGFVRNPWDRLVSWYSMIDEAKKMLPVYKRWFSRSPFKSDLWNQVFQQAKDFETFLYHCTDEVFDLGCTKSFAYNQFDYLCDEDNNLAVNFVGRFENLHNDVQHVFNQLCLHTITLPRKNPSKHTHYSQYYSDTTRQLVAKRFEKDIDFFGYTFESK